MELLGKAQDFRSTLTKFVKQTEGETSINHAQYFGKLVHQQMKVAHQLGKAIVHLRQLKAKLLELAAPQFETVLYAKSQGNLEHFENSLQELEYWEKFGEGRIYKVMVSHAKMEAQHYYESYQDITLKLEVLKQILDEQGMQSQIYPNRFLSFEKFAHLTTCSN